MLCQFMLCQFMLFYSMSCYVRWASLNLRNINFEVFEWPGSIINGISYFKMWSLNVG